MNNNVGKVVRDGKVAVLVSPGYGAGWSTWAREHAEEMLFCPPLVQAVLDGANPGVLCAIAETLFPDEYDGGVYDLEVEWVLQGMRFYINENDGSESLVILGDDYGYVA